MHVRICVCVWMHMDVSQTMSYDPLPKEAARWFEKAGNKGHAEAQFNLGEMPPDCKPKAEVLYIYIYTYISICMHGCMHACMYVCMYVHVHTYTDICKRRGR